MRKAYHKFLKSGFHSSLVCTRRTLDFVLSQMTCLHIKLVYGKNCCIALTFVLFRIYRCYNPLSFLGEMQNAVETENDRAA